MTWTVGRFSYAHLLFAIVLCGLIGAVVVVESLLETPHEEPVQSDARAPVCFEETNIDSIQLAPMQLIDADLNLEIPFHASAWVYRPGGMMPEGALCLRDKNDCSERDVNIGEPVYLKRENGRVTFALLGEKRPLWVIPKRLGDRVFLDAYMSVRGDDHLLCTVEVPFEGAKPWPTGGILVEGICVDKKLFEHLGAAWYGEDRVEPKLGERIVFSQGVCHAHVGDWFIIKTGGFCPAANHRISDAEVLIQLKERRPHQLEFEVVDSDAQHKLYLELPLSKEAIDERPLKHLHFFGRRQLTTVQVGLPDNRFIVLLGSHLSWVSGKWESGLREDAGAILRLDRIDKSRKKEVLYATLYSAHRSIEKQIEIQGES